MTAALALPATGLPASLTHVNLVCPCGGVHRWQHDTRAEGCMVRDFMAIEPACTGCGKCTQRTFDALNTAASCYRRTGRWPVWAEQHGETLVVDLDWYGDTLPRFDAVGVREPGPEMLVEVLSDERGILYGYATQEDGEE